MTSSPFYVQPGQEVTVSKTIGETDVYLFAGITGDLSSNHVNEHVMAASKYRHRIAHGALLVGFMSTGSTRLLDAFGRSAEGIATPVSLGYDRVRFLAAVLIGDTITVRYRVKEIEPERARSRGEITVTNQDGVLVAVAEHILVWVKNTAE